MNDVIRLPTKKGFARRREPDLCAVVIKCDYSRTGGETDLFIRHILSAVGLTVG